MRPDPSSSPPRRSSRTLRPDKIPSLKNHNVASTRSESPSVQDRIRQWQAQGAANALAPDTLSVRSLPISECPSTVSRPPTIKEHTTKERTRGRSGKKAEEQPQDARSKSTPRKRIVSDGHWKAKTQNKDPKGSPPQFKLPTRSSELDLTYTSTGKSRKERRSSRQHGEVMASDNQHQSSPHDDGIRVSALPDTVTQPGSDRPVSPSPYDTESRIDEELARYLTTESVYSADLETKSYSSIQPDELDTTPRRRSKYVETLGRAPAGAEEGAFPRSKKGKFFGKTKEILFMKSEGDSTSNRIPSIEAWLDEQPDPFVEHEDQNDLPPVEIPKPLRKRSERRRTSKEAPVLMDPNKIWDSVQPPSEPNSPKAPEAKSGQSKRRPSSNSTRGTPPRVTSTSAADEGDGSPSGLRRRGAKVRRERGSSARHGGAEPDIPELISTIEEDLSAGLEDKQAALPHRPCPPTGEHPLSTIASVETMRESHPTPSNLNQLIEPQCELKRKLTTHEDLLSVLSVPERGRSLRSAKSIRTSRPQRKSTSAHEVLAGLITDEQKYTRELRTLVDGVIPVLLQCVLSKTDSAAAASLFTSSPTPNGDFNFTRPIIEMGIALERLKTLHGRMPLQDIDSLLKWGQSAQKAYTDYLNAWRLGFHDVVVNLAPLDGAGGSEMGLASDDLGDAVNSDGEKVDVAYLLKRPLVRVKALGKTFAHIRDECDKPYAAKIASAYSDLTALAKRRFQEERARLEDEAAASLDATRARDIRTLAATTSAVINHSRRVKARDFFSLTLYHTNGQRIDCGVELIFRDNARGDPAGGDVLVCEVDASGKWLLFEPVELSSISARRGEGGFDLVVMIRGPASFGKEWHELLALKTDDPEAVTEWMAMLGSNPLPPRLNRTSSFVAKQQPLAIAPPPEENDELRKQEEFKKSLIAMDVDVPIGEPSIIGTRTNISRKPIPSTNKPLPSLNLGGGLVAKAISQYQAASLPMKQPAPSTVSSSRSTLSGPSSRGTATTAPSSLGSISHIQLRKDAALEPLHSPSPIDIAGKSTKAQTNISDHKTPSTLRRTDKDSREWMTSPGLGRSLIAEANEDTNPKQEKTSTRQEDLPTNPSPKSTPQRPEYKRTLSSTPSKDLPTVTKVRTSTPQPTAPMSTQGPTLEEKHSLDHRTEQGSFATTPPKSRQGSQTPPKRQVFTENVPTPPPHTSRQAQPPVKSGPNLHTSTPDSQSTRNGVQIRPSSKPILDLKPALSPSDKQLKRRTSSPLKHEYAPSTSSDRSSDYDTESISDSSSDTSEDVDSEHGDTPTPLVAIFGGGRQNSKPGHPPTSVPSTGTRTLAPSDSASQGPYRKVPSSSTVPMHKRSKAIALICSWSERGMWEQIHPDECSIVISPGLIEAFEMSAAHSDPRVVFGAPPDKDSDSRSSSLSQQPLVAFELTPIVPLRRGTALDISIRSPPTPNSKIQTTNNVMFRSRNAEECETLYGMINWARCNNPTYIQLQMARPARQPSVSFNVGQTGHSRSRSSSWFSFGIQRKSSYRASSAPTPASIDMSVESSGSMASAFSALKRFTANSGFNVNRSSVFRRPGSAGIAGSLYSSSSGTASGSGSSTPVPSQLGFVPGKDGPNVPSTSAAAAEGGGMINMMKIRLYVRKGQHWENLGAARLSVLPAPQATAGHSGASSGTVTPARSGTIMEGSSPPVTPAHGRSPSSVMTVGQPGQNRGPRLPSSSNTPHRIHGNGREKRLLIVKNKERDVVLLDSVLGESCFERIMQTGIAVKVWSESEAISHTGGVTMGRETLYMMQFPGTREAGWVFGLCGTYRYGTGLEGQ